MRVEFLGAETLGVRGLCCHVTTADAHYLIDPAVALAPRRLGKPPHLLELAAAKLTREKIDAVAGEAVVVVTHYHHDHLTPHDFHIYHWSGPEAADRLYRDHEVYAKPWEDHINRSQQRRAQAFLERYPHVVSAEPGQVGALTFSPPLWHGAEGSPMGWVTAVAIRDGDETVVLGSDLQALDDRGVDWIAEQRPDLAVLAGPPLYLQVLSSEQEEAAARRLARLARSCGQLVVDHHLCRGPWTRFLERVRALAPDRRIGTVADWAGVRPLPLESMRSRLHEVEPEPRIAARLAQGDPEALDKLRIAKERLQTGRLPEGIQPDGAAGTA